MKKQSMRLFPQLKTLMATVLLCMFAAGAALAQTFNPAFLSEYPYPVPGTVIPGPFPNPVNATTHSNAYTFSHMAYMTPAGINPAIPGGWPPGMPYPAPPPPMTTWLSDLTLHTWDDPAATAGLAWINKATGSGAPGTIYDQGFMMYPAGVQDLEATIQQDMTGFAMPMWGTTGTIFVVVSFYNSNPLNYTGVGHYVEVYSWNRPAPISTGGLTFVNRVQLSGVPNYTRIRQDGHNAYGFAITWEEPNPQSPNFGINYVMGFMNAGFPGVSMSPVYVVPGSAGWTYPDVAFSHATGGLLLQFIYHQVNAAGVCTVRESDIPFVLGPPWPVVSPPTTINDNNILPGVFPARIDIKSRIDAPDHYGPANWAYVYLLPGVPPFDIFVRYMNFNAPNFGVPATYDLTNASLLPITPMGIKGNDWPTIAFDASPDRVNVGWYTTYNSGAAFFLPNIGGYVDLQLDETGTVTSPTDYMQVALSTTGSNQQASMTPTICYSKQNDRTDYHFPVFANQMGCPAVADQMQTKERPWTATNFKGGANQQRDWSELYTAAKNTQVSTAAARSEIVVYPNPFSEKIQLKLPADMQDKQLNVVVKDIAGKEVERISGKGTEINSMLSNLGNKLAAGSYLLDVHTNDESYKEVFKVQKLAGK